MKPPPYPRNKPQPAAVAYSVKRPSTASLQATAADLRRSDDKATGAAASPEALAAARHERRTSSDRAHAAAVALPSVWRSRDKSKSPEWPPRDQLDTWRAIGASHALLLLPAPLGILAEALRQTPCALAYCLGYTEIETGYSMPNENYLALVDDTAKIAGITVDALEGHIASGDVSSLDKRQRTELLIALARHVGASPLVKPWMIVDNKLYPTATCASAIRIAYSLEANTIETATTVLLGVKMIKAVAECVDPKTGRTERAKAYVPWLVERVTKWGRRNGKPFPETKEWQEPTPEEVANKVMKAETKAERRVTLKFSALGTSAAEDVPGKAREWIEPEGPEEALDADFSEREPGDDGDEIEPPHADEAGG